MENICYKFRIFPTEAQADLISKTFGCSRLVYNLLLGLSESAYQKTGKHEIKTPALYKEYYPFLKDVDSLALCNSQLNLKKAYTACFRNLKSKKRVGDKNIYGFPRFKSKKDSKQSYTTNCLHNSIRIEDGKLRLPKVGLVSTIFHRRVSGTIKGATVSRTSTGKYFVSILTEREFTPTPLSVIGTGKERVLGLDFSFDALIVPSEGVKTNPPKWYYRQEQKISRRNRGLHKNKPGSRNREKARIALARAYEEMTLKKNDFLHKLSYNIVKEFDVVALEDIDLSAMRRCLNFGKSISSLGFGNFRVFLEYKMIRAGKKVWYAPKFFPSSQLCHVCGYKNAELKGLSIREWTCPCCGSQHDRDVNAAINLVQEYFRSLSTSASEGINACGEITSSNKEFLLSSDLVEAGKVETPERMSQAPAFRRG